MKISCPYCENLIKAQKEKYFPEYAEVAVNCRECKGLVVITKPGTHFKYHKIYKNKKNILVGLQKKND